MIPTLKTENRIQVAQEQGLDEQKNPMKAFDKPKHFLSQKLDGHHQAINACFVYNLHIAIHSLVVDS